MRVRPCWNHHPAFPHLTPTLSAHWGEGVPKCRSQSGSGVCEAALGTGEVGACPAISCKTIMFYPSGSSKPNSFQRWAALAMSSSAGRTEGGKRLPSSSGS